MTLTIYGPEGGRTARVIWAAKELGLDFDRVEVTADTKDTTYREINPNGRAPAIKDGELVLFESLAITTYLAQKYGAGSLFPTSIEDDARATQWALWAVTELEGSLIDCLRERVWKPEALRDAAAATAAEAKLQAPFKVLEAALSKHANLLGDAFTIADLNVSAVLSFAGKGFVDLSAYPKVKAWLTACQARPAAAGFAAAWPA